MSWETATTATSLLLGFYFFVSALEYFALPHLARRLLFFPGWNYLFCSLILWFFPESPFIWWPPIAVVTTTFYFTRRFNGGSDSVVFWVSGVLAFIYHFSSRNELVAVQLLLLLGAIGILCYFAAGLNKLLSRQWRSGETLSWSLKQSCFPKSVAIPVPTKILAFAVIGWELLFPMVLVNQTVAVIMVSLGFIFHLTMSWALGLNRFVLAFVCLYPAILFISPLRL